MAVPKGGMTECGKGILRLELQYELQPHWTWLMGGTLQRTENGESTLYRPPTLLSISG